LIYIFHGADEFAIRDLIRKIKAECSDGELGETATTVLDGGKVTIDELFAACHTVSFFSPKRLVIVEGLLSRFEKKEKRGKGKDKTNDLKDWDGLVKLDLPDSSVLVLADGLLKKTNPMLKKLAPRADVKECVPLDVRGADLPKWIASRSKAMGCEISPKAVRLLIDLIGNDLWILSSEIDKLSIHASESRIEENDINLLVSYAREANIFHMVDAVIQGRREVAVRLLHQLLSEGAAPAYLLHMIISEFRLLVQVKQHNGRGVSARVVGNKIGESKDWKVEKLMRSAGRYSSQKLEGIYHRLLETDISIKTGKCDGELALDLLINDLCK